MGNKVIRFGKYYSFQYKGNDICKSLLINIRELDKQRKKYDWSIRACMIQDKMLISYSLYYLFYDNLYTPEIHNEITSIITEILSKYDGDNYGVSNWLNDDTKRLNYKLLDVYVDQLRSEQNVKIIKILSKTKFLINYIVQLVSEYLVD